MKRSYVRILIFEIVLLVIFFLNSFVWNILNNYYMVLFLFINIILFRVCFGVEKDRHRYVKDIIFEIIICLLIFFLLYYLLGIIIGFYEVENYYSLVGVSNFIIPTILIVILREYFRYEVVTKIGDNKLLIVVTYIMFLMIDLTNVIYYQGFSSGYDMFIFVALYLLPMMSSNILGMYLAICVGYKPGVVYFLAVNLYSYLLPIVPNPNEYLKSIIDFLLPIIVTYRCYLFFSYVKDEDVSRDGSKKHIMVMIIPSILVIVLVYFTSGYFHYQAIAIASGSMSPAIYRGDVVIVQKIDENYDELEVGEVIAYLYNDVIVVHRLVDIVLDDGSYYFYSKGDANEDKDNYVITEDMVIGVVNNKIPYVGLPTVWLNELWEAKK